MTDIFVVSHVLFLIVGYIVSLNTIKAKNRKTVHVFFKIFISPRFLF